MSVRRLAVDEVQPAAFAFDAERQAEVDKWLLRYPAGRQQSAVIPLLMLAQEQEGWVTKPAVEAVARTLGMPLIRVLEVATFYTQFMLSPVGTKAHIQVCGTTPCWLRGAGELIEHCRTHIHPEPLHPNDEGTLSWEEVECQGACVNAPMVIIGKDAYEDLTVEKLDEIIQAFEAGNGSEVPTGPQNGRVFSMPVEGATTLTDEDAIIVKRDAKPQSGRGDQSASRRNAKIETAADTVAALEKMMAGETTAAAVQSNQPTGEPGYSLSASGQPVAMTAETKIDNDERLENPRSTREITDQAPPPSDVGAGVGEAAEMAEKMGEPSGEPSGGDKPSDAERAEMTKAAKPDGDAPEADTSIEGPADAEGPGYRDPAQQSGGGDKSDSSPAVAVADDEVGRADEKVSGSEGLTDESLINRDGDGEDLGGTNAAATGDDASDEQTSKAASRKQPKKQAETALDDAGSREGDTQQASMLAGPSGEETPAPPSGDDEEKPELYEGRPNDADDLGMIAGIGPKIHAKLNDLGIYKFSQIASWTPENAAYVDRHLSFRGRAERERWIEQADALAAGGADEYERRFGKKPR
ncbi:NADH-quinone oxidoreductase subunit NuoE [Notoacmeibacter ruber]|uniref:NADH-quinone oxidoreductase subunit NuoE n=1 Tax=Notoacmeibacter ruber TaxID=2670375 RepID=A0A3L7JAF0_9HYPH|nr:NADH-quinone oxidoreductase subunit NuoE [Notoacmeibacter ruber]RLQ87673.1 NADH-quinone oxidoreductase subunit NuoE [Notoacmeibacter ruber]